LFTLLGRDCQIPAFSGQKPLDLSIQREQVNSYNSSFNIRRLLLRGFPVQFSQFKEYLPQ
jgi:hypothetical protein